MIRVLTPGMLSAIASCAGNVYFVDASRCAVKMNGIVINLLQRGGGWFVSSSSNRFYDLVGRYGKSAKRGIPVHLTEAQASVVIDYISRIRLEEDK